MKKFIGRNRIAAVCAAAIVLMAGIFPVAFAADADYTFNAPDWMTDKDDGSSKYWVSDDGLALIGIAAEDNTEEYRITKLTSEQEQKLENIIETNFRNNLATTYTIDSVDVVNSGVETKCGYDAYGVNFKAELSYSYFTVEFVDQCYFFASEDHLFDAEMMIYSGNGKTSSHTIEELEQAFEDGFKINEKMPSDGGGAIIIIIILIILLLIVAGTVATLFIIRSINIRKRNKAVQHRTDAGRYPQKQFRQPPLAGDTYQPGYQQSLNDQYNQPQHSQPDYTRQYSQPQNTYTQPAPGQHQSMMLSNEDVDTLKRYKAMYQNGAITREQYIQVYKKITGRQ